MIREDILHINSAWLQLESSNGMVLSMGPKFLPYLLWDWLSPSWKTISLPPFFIPIGLRTGKGNQGLFTAVTIVNIYKMIIAVAHFKLVILKNILKFKINIKKKFGYTRSSLWQAGSLVVACRIWFPDQGWNSGPLDCEHKVLATGPLGKSLNCRYKWIEWHQFSQQNTEDVTNMSVLL